MSTVSALARSTHPGPTATVTVLALVLCVAVSLGPLATVVAVVAVLAGQVSIGLSNDLLDLARDRAVGRTDKPVALGEVSPAAVGRWAAAAAVVGVALPFAVSVPAGLAHLVLVASGWAYNLGLKRTAASVLPFVVSFGLLPAVVTLALTPPAPPAAWALGVGGVFGVAIHFTNVLPDLGDDAATGVSGLPHRLGRLRAGLTAFVALAVAALLTFVGQLTADGTGAVRLVVAVVGLVLVLGLAAAGTAAVVRGSDTRLLFRLIIVAALVLVVQLALSGAALVA